MKSNPDFKLNARLESVGFKTSVQGSGEATIDSVSLNVGEIPIRVAIPFLKPRGKYPILTSIGPFDVKISPIELKLKAAKVELDGVLGTKGIAAKMEGKVNCETDLKLAGCAAGKVGNFLVKFEDEDLDDVE
ncbi:MAG: hypothetical protein GY869_22945 [Planctomycetes bacterium]|nr:hypothetical protein [Planctomycetota bacterium]